MRPTFMITADGIDVTAGFNDRMTDLKVVDHDGMQSDEVSIILDDRDFALALPRKGALLAVHMGYDGANALMGTFKVNRRKRHFKKGQGRVMEIGGKSADLRKEMKRPRTGAYKDKTYEQLVQEVAGRHGLGAKVSPSLAGLKYKWEPQSEESDLHLLTRIARDHDAICKVAGGMVIVLARDDLAMAALVLDETDFIECVVEDDDRAQHAKSTAHYHDRGKVRREPETVEYDGGDSADDNAGDGPEYMLRHTYPDQELARAAAKGRQSKLQREEKRLHGVMTGNPAIMAGLPVVIAWGVELYDGNYNLKTVTHHMTKSGGYTTTIDSGKGKGKGGKGGKSAAAG